MSDDQLARTTDRLRQFVRSQVAAGVPLAAISAAAGIVLDEMRAELEADVERARLLKRHRGRS